MSGSQPTTDEHPVTFDLLTENPVYKPFRYPWAYDAWLMQQRVHWLPEEVPLADDVKDALRDIAEAAGDEGDEVDDDFAENEVVVSAKKPPRRTARRTPKPKA